MAARRSLLLCFFLVVGCASSPDSGPEDQGGEAPAVEEAQAVTATNEGDPGGAQAVDGWPGTPNVTREGTIYFAGQPDEAGLRHASEVGVALVVNLRGAREMSSLGFDEAAEVRGLGMRYVTIPVTPASLSKDDVSAFAEAMSETAGPVLVHCRSSNRVGALWAAYLALEKGVALNEALERGRKGGMKKAVLEEAVRRVVE